jgi:sulfide:quinone oxidoreductase
MQLLDAALRSVRLEKNEELVADYLVIALGAGKAAPKGVENTHTISGTPQDTSKLHDALAELTAKGHGSVAMGFGGNPKDGSAVRGGPLFEVLFNFDLHLRRRNLRDKFQLTFFAPMEKPGLRMGERAAQAVGEFLSRSGIEQRVGKPIESFDKEGVNLKDGGRIQADLVVFVPAGSGHPVLQQSGLPLNEAGFVKIDGACRVLGHSRVYVVGDSAALEGPEWRAKQGHVTVAMAQIAARSILADIRNQEFNEDYRPHVDILCVMDTGNAAALVHRTSAHSWFVNLPIIGHWLKKAWGVWFRWSHRRIFHRPLPS